MGIKSTVYTIKQKLSLEAKNMLQKLNNQEKLINYQELYLKGGLMLNMILVIIDH